MQNGLRLDFQTREKQERVITSEDLEQNGLFPSECRKRKLRGTSFYYEELELLSLTCRISAIQEQG